MSKINNNLIIPGQCVFIFNTDSKNEDVEFFIYNKDKTNGIKVLFTKENVSIFINYIKLTMKIVNDNIKGLIDTDGAYYWFSLDSHNQRLYAGIGEPRIENIIYYYQFTITKDNKLFLESLVNIQYTNKIKMIKLLKDPISFKVPLIVKNTDELSMYDVASNNYLPKSFLSLKTQVLYDCISGHKFTLNDDDFPDFSKAIENSIKTPGLWCYEKLKDKSTEFNKDKPNILETYLRITLGENNGESPGIPFVMEIWPVGHYSPIHNHGGADAIIRVLNGSINVSLFPFLGSNEPFIKSNFTKDQITWISPILNQTHQLTNLETNTETCITIQCYMYENKDKVHYDYFDYIDDNEKVQQYEPDSDMDYISFRNLMKQEWNNM